MKNNNLNYFQSHDYSSLNVLPPSIIPVVVVCGTEYQMGYQYGQQVGHYIEIMKNSKWATTIKQHGFSYNEVVKDLKAIQYYIKKYAPEVIEEIRGIADGAKGAGYNISYIDILLLNYDIGYSTHVKKSDTAEFPSEADSELLLDLPSCTSWAAWGKTTIDKRLVCGQSCDLQFYPQVTLLAFPNNGNNYMTVTNFAGQLTGTFSMNNKGVFIGRSGGFSKRDLDFDYGITYQCAFAHIIRYAENAFQAKDKILSFKLADSMNYLLTDSDNNAFVIEVTSNKKCVRKPGDFHENDFVYATNNYLCDEMQESIKGEKYVKYAGWVGDGYSINSISRNLQMRNMLNKYQGKVDIQFAKMMWRFHGNPPPYPLDAKYYYSSKGEGWDTQIGNLCNEHVVVAMPSNPNNGVAYICAGPAGKIAHPNSPINGDWYQIDGTNSFYQLTLKSNIAEIVDTAKDESHRCIAEAYRKFMMLNYTIPGYAVLKDFYSKANKEYYKGVNAFSLGSLKKDNNELCFYLSQALTAFTRSQIHSKQLLNEITPPATSPTDLGLEPYKEIKE